jgi:photosystem II stability/assembly factor-like uncharacterized protein
MTNTQAYLLNTSDAGLTWSQQQLFTGSAIAYHTVCRVNSTVGYVIFGRKYHQKND